MSQGAAKSAFAPAPANSSASAPKTPGAAFAAAAKTPSAFGSAGKPAGSMFAAAAKPTAVPPAGTKTASTAFSATAKPQGTAFSTASASAKPGITVSQTASRPASAFSTAARPNLPGVTPTQSNGSVPSRSAVSVGTSVAPVRPGATEAAKAILAALRTNTSVKSSSRNPDVVPESPRRASGPDSSKDVSDIQYRRFSQFIETECGIVLGTAKQYLVNSRLSQLLPKFRCDTVDDLINLAMEEKPNNAAKDAVIDAMTTNETLWFRDTYPYLALQNIILPELAMKGKDYGVRIWSAACSSGQEPYSIAMTIQEQMTRMVHIDPANAQIIGTDLSPEMLAQCKAGLYDSHALSRGLTPERRAKFFKPAGKPNMMRVDPRLRQMVEFRPINLLGSFALMGRFDVIFCRNVLIYFSNDVKANILRKLTMCLNPGGYLILGSTESLTGVAENYEMIRCNPGIIYRLKKPR